MDAVVPPAPTDAPERVGKPLPALTELQERGSPFLVGMVAKQLAPIARELIHQVEGYEPDGLADDVRTSYVLSILELAITDARQQELAPKEQRVGQQLLSGVRERENGEHYTTFLLVMRVRGKLAPVLTWLQNLFSGTASHGLTLPGDSASRKAALTPMYYRVLSEAVVALRARVARGEALGGETTPTGPATVDERTGTHRVPSGTHASGIGLPPGATI